MSDKGLATPVSQASDAQRQHSADELGCGGGASPVPIARDARQPGGAPALNNFLLYAERSVHLGHCCRMAGGDLGVHAVARQAGQAQMVLEGQCSIEQCHTLYAPTVRLGSRVSLGRLYANHLEDDGVPLGTVWSFPAADMPAPPLAMPASTSSVNIEVSACDVVALQPGGYGCLRVEGTLLLNPGVYECKALLLADGARLLAIAGSVELRIADALTAGRRVELLTAFHRPARHFSISVGGQDSGCPTASFGEGCHIRALLAVPQGTLTIADHCHGSGAFAAFDIVLGAEVELEFQDGFPPQAPGQSGSQQLQGYYGPNPDPAIAPLDGPVPANAQVPLAIGLPVRDATGLKTFIGQVSDPRSPLFRKYLSGVQFNTTYGATDADYAALRAWALGAGLTVYADYPSKLLLSVGGSAAQIGAALHVNLVYRLRRDGQKFIAVDREPSLNLSVPLLRIGGISESRAPLPAAVATGGCSGSGSAATGRFCGDSLRAADLRNAYLGPNPDLLALTGIAQTIAILALDSYVATDIAGYDVLQLPPINPGGVSVIQIPGPPFTSYSPTVEAALDIQMVQAMAPAANILVFQSQLGVTLHADDVLHAMASYAEPLSCVTCSYVFGRSDNAEQALQQLAARGVSCFCASGDFGDIGDPQSNINMLPQTLVGGTLLSTNSLASGFPSPSYPAAYYAGEVVWNQSPGAQQKGASSGGIMDGNNQNGQCYCWPYSLGPFSCCGSGVDIPNWQTGVMELTAAANGGSTRWRNYPDVALVASGVEIMFQGSTQIVGGTSAAAPVWAGLTALINERIQAIDTLAPPAGFLNPALYQIGLTRGSANDLSGVCFNDIVNGNNANGFGAGFNAVPGYDLCTGLGSPKPGLIYQLSSPTPLTPNQPLSLIRLVISCGDDGCGGGLHGSDQTADLLLKDGSSFTVSLRHRSEPNWDKHTDHTIDRQVPATVLPPLTESNPLSGVRINLIQDNPDFSADNWDITALSVSLYNPPFDDTRAVCQLKLVGGAKLQDGSTGLVRLSKSAGDSGNGPSSPVFATGPGSGCS